MSVDFWVYPSLMDGQAFVFLDRLAFMPPKHVVSAVRSRAAVAAASRRSAEKKAVAALINGPSKPADDTADPKPRFAAAAIREVDTSVVDDQRAPLLVALREELDGYSAHPVLGSSVLHNAKAIFELYLTQQWNRGEGLDSSQMTFSSLERALHDIGVVLSSHEIKDLVFTLTQPQEVTHHNAHLKPQSSSGILTTPDARNAAHDQLTASQSRKSSLSVANSNRASVATTEGVSFPTFLDILVASHSDCNYHEEMEHLWRMLDLDGDGVLSQSDLEQAIKSGCLHDTWRGPPLTSEIILELLDDLDVDFDGCVMKSDFLASTNTN